MVTADRAQCFTSQELADFASGRVSIQQLDGIAAHVDTCPACQATVSGLEEQPDSFVRDLRDLPGEANDGESACQEVVQQLLGQHTASTAARVNPPPMPGAIGGYRVLERVGAGGMGVVYKGQHPKLKRLVAIKLLPIQRWAGPAAVARFEREMEVCGALDHPNIVRASDAGEEAGMQFLVMDFVDGLDLSRLVRRMGPLPVADACEIVRQAAIGLSHVHASGLIHRDIKPSNVMVTQDGQVKVLDLGLAMLGEQYLEGENNLTTIGQLMGTLDYMAPEQAADSHSIDARADVYSLGATLFHLITGRAPYGGTQHNSLLKKVVALASSPVPSAAEEREDVPAELDDILCKCLAKDPQQRYASVEQVAESLSSLSAMADLPKLMRAAASRPEPVTDTHAFWSIADAFAERPEKQPRKARQHLPSTDARSGRFTTVRRVLVAAAAMALVALGVIVFRIATDRGELIVRSEDPNARLLIQTTDGKPVRELTLEQGKGQITIRSGRYAVRLFSDIDSMAVDKNQITVSRGRETVLTVQERRKPGGQDAAAQGSAMGMGMGMEMGGAPGMMAGEGPAGMGGEMMSGSGYGMGMGGDEPAGMEGGMGALGDGMAMGGMGMGAAKSRRKWRAA